MIPRRVWLAILIAFLCHGLFILTARYRLSYDAYTHMLFANHYAENWFSLWETRWYTGFTVVSYPPLIHQLIALFIPMLGFDAAFALVLWIVTTLYPLGIYAFSRIFTGKTSASYAALASALLLPIYVTAHIFGQLPFLASTLIALFGAASLDRYLREGGVHNLLLTVSLIATSTASHHATLLVQPFLIFAVFISNLVRPSAHLFLRSFAHLRFRPYAHLLICFSALLLVCFLALLSSALVVWPFWQWGMHQTMQAPIDHPSRHNFFTDPLAPAIFFFPLYGPLLAVIPFIFYNSHRRYIGLIISFVILSLLGLGGTTPLPRLFFGDAWEWLTYDRFAFWACLLLTPFFGILFVRLKRGWKTRRLITKPLPVTLRRNFIPALTFSVFALTTLGAWLTPLILPIQPAPIEMQPIVEFLNKADRSQWRYLTFGFGDQFARLNLLTSATTIDGSYHTARSLPELRRSGIGQIDTVYWAQKGVPAIIPILQKSGGYGVRWGFVNPEVIEVVPLAWETVRRNPFVPVLEQLGWIKRETLADGILVYENPNAIIPHASRPPMPNPLAEFSWGTLPMLSLLVTLSLGALRIYPVQAERVLRSIHAFVVGFIPISLCFWYYRTLVEIPHERVYFTYSHALFFLPDALALLAVILWLSARIALHESASHTPRFVLFLFILFLLSSFSILWSTDWRVSLYVSLHLWLVFLLILSLRDWNASWQPAMYGFCAALTLQFIAGFTGFALQSTTFLDPLELKWPGILDPSMRGSTVVELADGARILRAYGTLPHPNILGGFTLFALLGPASLVLAGKRAEHPALILFALGASLLALTFSRSAWLGMVILSLVLILKSKYLDRKQLALLLLTAVLGFAITLLPYLQLVQARTVNIASNSEIASLTGRIWLNQEAAQMISEHPLTGVGIGSFIIELSQRAGEGYIIEPVHNIPLLAGAELGILGIMLVLALSISIAFSVVKAQTPRSILAGAALAGFGIIGLFDHYLWTIAPCRLMLGLALGLWTGQVSHDQT